MASDRSSVPLEEVLNTEYLLPIVVPRRDCDPPSVWSNEDEPKLCLKELPEYLEQLLTPTPNLDDIEAHRRVGDLEKWVDQRRVKYVKVRIVKVNDRVPEISRELEKLCNGQHAGRSTGIDDEPLTDFDFCSDVFGFESAPCLSEIDWLLEHYGYERYNFDPETDEFMIRKTGGNKNGPVVS